MITCEIYRYSRGILFSAISEMSDTIFLAEAMSFSPLLRLQLSRAGEPWARNFTSFG